MPRLLLLDTASLYYRAFFGLPDTLRSPDGTPVNALRGLLDFVATLTRAYEADAVAACWDDAWRPTWRVDLLPSYKAHRVASSEEQERTGHDGAEETPDGLGVQVPLIREALGLLGVRVVGHPDHEADDVIATLATGWDGPVDVVTGDRDLFQLVDDAAQVRVLYTARGVGRHEQVTDEVVLGRYGVHADRYVDLAVLRGDPSDGLPGIPGVGDKTAAALVEAHGDLDGIRAAAADPDATMRPKVRAAIVDGAAYLDVAPAVVRVVRDLPLGLDLPGDLLLGAAGRHDGFVAFAERWGLGGVAERVTGALDARG